MGYTEEDGWMGNADAGRDSFFATCVIGLRVWRELEIINWFGETLVLYYLSYATHHCSETLSSRSDRRDR